MERSKFQAIIAHPVPEEQRRIAALLERGGLFSVCHMTHDGLDCLREAVSRQPELVVIHAVLDKIDGLEVLRRLGEFPLPRTRRLYLTSFNSFLSEHAVLAGADHCILTPCPDEVLVRRACELLLPPHQAVSDAAINAHTVRYLHRIGASENKKGYYYAVDGARILVRDPKLVMRRKVTTELYGGIASLHGLESVKQVERCLRTLTNQIFRDNSLRALEQYFTPADVRRGRVTNTAFLSTVAQYVTSELEAEGDAARRAEG